ncbi:ferritin-like domain-containing protein [Sphingomonas sp. PL-96]|uniref:ferritin-like domain-containing protein n=1 Tax=Sphingomonas sp. PL-96 TaxID=2887201 RepID=UPI002B4C1248|nr:ferritin-like domain-containing protein [Sphingomonas sp. PL-96]MCC2976604.1 ferritin-like domain-containing protein [Sphingomonas sp. PL-96]
MSPAPAPLPPGDVARLNFVLNLVYLGAQFHGQAVAQAPASDLLTGVGRLGAVRGGHPVAFSDKVLDRYASEAAGDSVAQIVALRRRLGSATAAQPTLDLAPALRGPAGTDARSNTVLDRSTSDRGYLLGAFFIGDTLPAVTRTLLADIADAGAQTTLAGILAHAIYHAGVVRTLLVMRASADPSIGEVAGLAGAMQRRLAGPDPEVVPEGASADLMDIAGIPIPFFRSVNQVLRALTSSANGPQTGGFFPSGINGVPPELLR